MCLLTSGALVDADSEARCACLTSEALVDADLKHLLTPIRALCFAVILKQFKLTLTQKLMCLADSDALADAGFRRMCF